MGNNSRRAGTCHSRRAGINPFVYLRHVLTRIASHPHHRLAELLPSRWKPDDA